MPAASHSSQPLKAYKPKKLIPRFLPKAGHLLVFSHKSPQDNFNRLSFLSSSLTEQCHQCNVTNIKTLQHKTLSLSLSLQKPQKTKISQKKSCKTNLEICSILSQKKASRILDTHQKN
jgi:hypothetical protein